jgi:hypothetical protein
VMSILASKRRRDNDDDEDYLQKLAAEIEYAILALDTLPVYYTSCLARALYSNYRSTPI